MSRYEANLLNVKNAYYRESFHFESLAKKKITKNKTKTTTQPVENARRTNTNINDKKLTLPRKIR